MIPWWIDLGVALSAALLFALAVVVARGDWPE